jgi:hypothetical protein
LALGSLDVAAPARWRCSDKELPDKGVACIGSSEFGSFDAQTYISASGKAPTVQESRAIWSSIKERFDAATLVGEQESLDQAGGAAWRMSFESGEARVDIAAKTYEGGLAVGMVSNKDAAKTGQAQKARNDFLAQF